MDGWSLTDLIDLHPLEWIDWMVYRIWSSMDGWSLTVYGTGCLFLEPLKCFNGWSLTDLMTWLICIHWMDSDWLNGILYMVINGWMVINGIRYWIKRPWNTWENIVFWNIHFFVETKNMAVGWFPGWFGHLAGLSFLSQTWMCVLLFSIRKPDVQTSSLISEHSAQSCQKELWNLCKQRANLTDLTRQFLMTSFLLLRIAGQFCRACSDCIRRGWPGMKISDFQTNLESSKEFRNEFTASHLVYASGGGKLWGNSDWLWLIYSDWLRLSTWQTDREWGTGMFGARQEGVHGWSLGEDQHRKIQSEEEKPNCCEDPADEHQEWSQGNLRQAGDLHSGLRLRQTDWLTQTQTNDWSLHIIYYQNHHKIIIWYDMIWFNYIFNLIMNHWIKLIKQYLQYTDWVPSLQVSILSSSQYLSCRTSEIQTTMDWAIAERPASSHLQGSRFLVFLFQRWKQDTGVEASRISTR